MTSSSAGEPCPYVEPLTAPERVPPGLRLAVAGKGGSGKTTIAATLARLLARSGRQVVAVDADTNPNLGSLLGIGDDRLRSVGALPRSLIEREQQPDGTIVTRFTRDPMDVLAEHGATGPDGVRLIVMGAVGHGGAG